VPRRAVVRADGGISCPATKRAAIPVIETDSISVIGPIHGGGREVPGLGRGKRRRVGRYHAEDGWPIPGRPGRVHLSEQRGADCDGGKYFADCGEVTVQ
jgi:hypothetical protein